MTDFELGKWSMFDLISSVILGRQVYILNEDGSVFSRYTCKDMTLADAYNEFLRALGADE